MKTESVRWLAPRKNRRLLVVFFALIGLGFLLLEVFPSRLQGTLARNVSFAFLLAVTLSTPLLLYLFMQAVPGRPETFLFKAYWTFVCILFAIQLALIFVSIPEFLRILLGGLFWTSLLLPKAIVLWTVPDVPGAWDFGVIPERPLVSPKSS